MIDKFKNINNLKFFTNKRYIFKINEIILGKYQNYLLESLCTLETNALFYLSQAP